MDEKGQMYFDDESKIPQADKDRLREAELDELKRQAEQAKAAFERLKEKESSPQQTDRPEREAVGEEAHCWVCARYGPPIGGPCPNPPSRAYLEQKGRSEEV